MLIGKDYKIETDRLNVTLSQKKLNKKTGKEYWQQIRYYSRVGIALKGIADLELADTELKDFKAVCKKQRELYNLIDGLKVSAVGVK